MTNMVFLVQRQKFHVSTVTVFCEGYGPYTVVGGGVVLTTLNKTLKEEGYTTKQAV